MLIVISVIHTIISKTYDNIVCNHTDTIAKHTLKLNDDTHNMYKGDKPINNALAYHTSL